MAHWSLDDIPWRSFDSAKVQPEIVSLAKAACMVEHNSHDYARYLCEVFAGDAEFQDAARLWAEEEVQHGQALRRWAELADPQFDFDRSFKAFTEGYRLPQNVVASVRGSRSGELIARCVVESGTVSYYTALKEYTEEPVLREICARIAGDEFRHYKLFYDHLKRYLARERLGLMRRLSLALDRVFESGDDELAYAFFAAHHADDASARYDRRTYKNRYWAYTCRVYRREHIERLVSMVCKAVGLKPHGRIHRALAPIAWRVMRTRAAT